MTAGRRVNTQSQNWGTPAKYVNAVKAFWDGKIDLDPCSNEYSIVHAATEYRLPEQDGLKESWNYPTIYVNPPYGADRQRGTTIKDWLARCARAHIDYKSEVIALVPVATNTSHWNGIDRGKGAPMACCLVYWGNNYRRFAEQFMIYGAVTNISNLKQVRIGKDRYYSSDIFAQAI